MIPTTIFCHLKVSLFLLYWCQISTFYLFIHSIRLATVQTHVQYCSSHNVNRPLRTCGHRNCLPTMPRRYKENIFSLNSTIKPSCRYVTARRVCSLCAFASTRHHVRVCGLFISTLHCYFTSDW